MKIFNSKIINQAYKLKKLNKKKLFSVNFVCMLDLYKCYNCSRTYIPFSLIYKQ